MNLETTQFADDRNKALIADYADTLADLGVLSADNYTAVTEHLEQAEAVHVIVAEVEGRRARAIADATTKLTTGDVTADKITAAALKLPANEDVHDVALALWRAHIRDAKSIVVRAFGDVPAVLTSRLDDVSQRGLAAADVIANVQTAEAAISAGRTAEWTEFKQAVGEYNSITSLVSTLRFDKLIAGRGVRDAEDDRFAWNFRRRPKQVVRTGLRQGGYSDAEKRALVIEAWKSGPWVPGSKDDVAAVLATELAPA